MKLPLLLTQFFYQYKKLNLPGIGSFTLDPSAVIPEDTNKTPQETIEGIEFRNIPINKADDELIDYIRQHTGKIRPLAESDLDSYLALGIQLLNIGKPFYFEGIGAVTKNQEGGYNFTPGVYTTIKLEESEDDKKEKAEKRKSIFEEQHDDYQPQTNSLRKFLVVVGVLGGLALIAWGGYTLYQKNTYPESNNIVANTKDTVAEKTDTVQVTADTVLKKDSAIPKNTVAERPVVYTGDSVLYKFVILATANKYKALKRYEQLLSYSLRIKLQTKDSSFFKLYFSIPAYPKDTLYIKDSINRIYATKAFIER